MIGPCDHRSIDGLCEFASALADAEVKPTPENCYQCQHSADPMQDNVVIYTIAIDACKRKGVPADSLRKQMRNLPPLPPEQSQKFAGKAIWICPGENTWQLITSSVEQPDGFDLLPPTVRPRYLGQTIKTKCFKQSEFWVKNGYKPIPIPADGRIVLASRDLPTGQSVPAGG